MTTPTAGTPVSESSTAGQTPTAKPEPDAVPAQDAGAEDDAAADTDAAAPSAAHVAAQPADVREEEAAQAKEETIPALDLSGVVSGYEDTTVLRGVSLTVPRGTAVALLGPNGAGKTTLLRTVCGLLRPTAGRVEMEGTDITRLAPHRRARLGLCHIPEGRGIFRSLTVRENLIMQSFPGGESAAIERAVEAFPVLGERLTQTAGTLSGGQQQMLAMAQAHVRSPKLILVDEASLGLAPVIVDEIFAFLQAVSAEGTSLLLVDQFVVRALGIATTAYVLRRGEIVFGGPAAELMSEDVFARYVGGAED
ncbi:High-affinity branched-chain amino acid transport ATP-binding protein BraG (modular protein) [Frankia canadensis]|uniref:High-affinity branched-chain amino acid transport ATP-binding protein BraG (Modular protein) n=1 Tax=Frankia canadensis TaxID=1836972 RepID=A0A2I2KWA0_9ACTN|nr:ABC transporter ATP-binding protein [Frankia canadensis]SNQ49941.1 High-affinity branched-chain amino acid transport ATP-binding protein BraG (modular protein) [Frankia canadensis]SOU57231.1 High-affinity branched-chain amino acid transport ATP-binding protein BraG (modular protein) [Frankia canadensis]